MNRITLSLSAALLLAASTVLAGDYVVLGGPIGIRKLDTPAAVIRQVPVKHWGTDDREVYVVVTLTAVGPDGNRVCTVVNEFTRPLGEAVEPVAFQLGYMKQPKLEVPIRVATATYKILSTVTWRELPPSNKQGTRKNEYPATLPLGGTPSCVKFPL